MQNDLEHARLSPEVRRKILIAQGALFRAEVFHAMETVQEGLRPESLARDAVSHLASMAMAAFRDRSVPGLPGIELETVLPLVITGVSALSKKSLIKPAIRIALALGALGAVAAWVTRKK